MDKLFFVTQDGLEQPYKLEQIQLSARGYIAFVEDITTREQANSIKGHRICVLREDLPTLDPSEFYIHDLIGLDAWDGEVNIGKITSSRQSGDIEIVTVENETFEVEVPLVGDLVEKIDFSAKKILLKSTFDLPRSHKKKRD